MDFLEFLPLLTQAGSTIMSAGGDASKGDAALVVGQRKKALADFQATQLETNAGQEIAASQRVAENEVRNTALINSAALARAAASGAGASDPTVINIMARTAGMGAYRANVALYQGEAQARADRIQASALRFQGDTALSDAETAQGASRMTAGATLFSGGAKAYSLAAKYFTSPKTDTKIVEGEWDRTPIPWAGADDFNTGAVG